MDVPGIPDERYGMKLTVLDSDRNLYRISEKAYQSRRRELVAPGTGYTFETDEDIIEVVGYLAGQAKDESVFPVRRVRDPRRMMKLGLWPTSVKMNHPWVAEWLEGADLGALEFWYPEVSPTFIANNLREEMNWQYRTLQTLKQQAVREGNSIALKLCAPEMLYRGSNRPVTDMSLFRSPLSITVNKEDIVRGRLRVEREVFRVVPVTRCAAGMSKGLYYAEEDVPYDVCGTFFYREEESSTYLAYKTELRAFNKTDACRKLGIRLPDNPGIANRRVLYANSGAQKHLKGTYPRDLMLTPRQALDYMNSDDSIAINLPPVAHYAAERLDLYAAEDYLDQALCSAAREAGYDIVVLEAMVGSFQIVTEVLDTRSREDSFRSLVYVVA